MRLVKKVKFNRIQEISQFKKLESTFNNIKENSEQCILSSIKDLSRLNFYFVIEYINLVHDKINYDKIFPEDNENRHSSVDFNVLMEEQDRLKKYISNKTNKGPEYFKKLGILNEVVGCFVIATIKKNVRSVQNLDFSKKEHSIVIKIDIDKLPKEFEQICIDFAKNKQEFIDKEHKEFEKFINLSEEEQDNIIQDILNNIQYPQIIFMDLSEMEMNKEEDNLFPEINYKIKPHTATTIEMAAENNVEISNNEVFLNGMLQSALETENYELCARIRDRLIALKNQFKV